MGLDAFKYRASLVFCRPFLYALHFTIYHSKEIENKAILSTASLKNDEAKILMGVLESRLFSQEKDPDEMVTWDKNDLIEYAFECSEEIKRLKYFAEILKDLIIEVNFLLNSLEESLYSESEEPYLDYEVEEQEENE
ncbi:hypothetical protein [Aerococcus loyolae]|uniref:hypothetical protein n=1 Tax=Aerococcus loyolae TaxID=2976809 RepID=UPI0011BD95B4|nr:hypothetical protein [Aerococcus loyolae]